MINWRESTEREEYTHVKNVYFNYNVNLNPTLKEFNTTKYLDRRIFLETAKKRFNKLDSDYINKKFKEEKYPTEGNYLLGNSIFEYLKNNLSYLEKKKEIILLDIGATGGALSTIFAIKALDACGLLKKTKIILVDIAQKALNATSKGNFFLRTDFIQKYNLTNFGKHGEGIKKALSKANCHCSNMINLPKEIKKVDICIAGFSHTHLNLFDKELACKEMERVTLKGGFIGVVDESLDYKQYLKWLNDHKYEKNYKNERVRVAQQCFISINQHLHLFSSLRITKAVEKEEYYCFCGIKN